MTAVLDTATSTAPSTDALLARIDAALGELSQQPLDGSVSDAALLERVERLERIVRAATAEKLRGVNELDTRSAAAGLGARTTADLLTDRLGLTKAEARRQTRTAQALDELPQTAQRLRNGDIGIGHADTAAQVFATLGVTDEATTTAFDALVADEATAGNQRQLRDRLDDFAHRHDPDRLADRDRRAHARRYLRRWIDHDHGLWRCDAALPLAAGALIDTALDGLITRDQRPHVDATTPCDHHHGDHHHHDGDDQTWEQKAADALVGMATHTVASADLPTVHAEAARVLLITTDRDSPPAIDGVGAVSDETAAQLRCDAETRYVRHTRNGTTLDVGRARRSPTPRQRAAVIARDRGCIGCGAPARVCQIHHIHPYSHGGATDEPNLVLVCWNCHHHLHHHGWRITGDHIRGFAITRPTSSSRRRRTP